MDETEKNDLESFHGLFWTVLAGLAAFASADTMLATLVLAATFELTVFLDEHLDADGGDGHGDEDEDDKKDRPKHERNIFANIELNS